MHTDTGTAGIPVLYNRYLSGTYRYNIPVRSYRISDRSLYYPTLATRRPIRPMIDQLMQNTGPLQRYVFAALELQ